MSIAQQLISMLLLKTAPQDLPYSPALLGKAVLLYLASGVVVLTGVVEPGLALARMGLSLGVLMFFTWLGQSMLQLTARFVQTMTALVGVGIVFNLLAWPLLGQLNADLPQAMSSILSIAMLMLVSWEVMITAHIYRHALNMQLAVAIILAIGLFFVSMTLTQLLLPNPGDG